MRGKDRYRHVKSSQTSRKEDRPLIFSGVLGVTTSGENQVEVNGRPGFVWVRLRNQLNELIQAFNETVAPVFDLPVLVEYDKANPIRYKVISRDVGRYTVWVTTNAAGDTVPSTSPYLPAHGASHSFNKLTGVGGGDVVWVYGDQFIPWLVTPSGSSGALSVSMQPGAYFYDQEFRWAGGTGIAGFDTLRPTGSSNARMLLVYLDPDTGNPYLATGTLTEFANTITGSAQIMPYVPPLIEPTDIPLAGVRLITGTSRLLWQNLYDFRDYFAHSSVSGTTGYGGAPDNAQYVVMAVNGDLSDERVLTAGADIDIADGGAGGNATVSVETGTFARPGHVHTNELPIFEDSVFQATGTIIDFGENVNVAVTGTVVFVSTVDTQGGGGGGDLLVYDDSVFKVTGTALSFDTDLEIHVTGSIAYIKSTAVGGAGGFPAIYDDSVFKATGTSISFDDGLEVVSTGSTAYVSSVDIFGYAADGRLTVESNNPIPTGSSSGATTIYYTPYVGDRIALYDGSDWSIVNFTNTSLPLTGFTASTPYDIFGFATGSSLGLESIAWTDGTNRATDLSRQNGIYVKSGDATRRYLGTIYINSTGGQTEDTDTQRFVWNYYNRINKRLVKLDATTHTYTTTSWRYYNNDSSNKVEYIIGIIENTISFSVWGDLYDNAFIGIGINSSSSSPIGQHVRESYAASGRFGTVFYQLASLGYNYAALIEYGSATADFDSGQIGLMIKC